MRSRKKFHVFSGTQTQKLNWRNKGFSWFYGRPISKQDITMLFPKGKEKNLILFFKCSQIVCSIHGALGEVNVVCSKVFIQQKLT